jgi:hypothetical protein
LLAVTPPDRSRGRGALRSSPGDRPTLTQRRAAALERRRAAQRRRRIVAALLVLVVAAAGVGAYAALSRKSAKTTGPATTTTRPGTPTSYNVGVTVFDWSDPSRPTPSPTPTGTSVNGRLLKTEVWYPTLRGSATGLTGGARPASGEGPFPVVFFAHGFDTTPQTYAPLLSSWVRAGFVVVAPLFPDEQQDTVVASGGPANQYPEGDLSNEPGDLAFVAKQFAVVTAAGSKSPLAGVADLSRIALAGQSDGATAVAGLAYEPAYAAAFSSLPSRPKAALVLSGQALSGSTPAAATSNSPALLQVQSDSDTCQSPAVASYLFGDVFSGSTGAQPDHLFLTLHAVAHLAPYTGGRDSTLVEKVTTDFLKLELGWHAEDVSVATVTAAAAVPGTSSITENPSGLPAVASNCTGLATTRATPLP